MEIGIKKIQINKYIKYSLIIIVLNILDLALTYIGVTNNWAKEINPLLEPYVTDLYIMSGLKIAMPLILFGYIAIRL